MLVNILGDTIDTEDIYRIGPIEPEEKTWSTLYYFKIFFLNKKEMRIERSVSDDVLPEDIGDEILSKKFKKDWPSGDTIHKLFDQKTDINIIAERTKNKLIKVKKELEYLWQGHQSPIHKIEF